MSFVKSLLHEPVDSFRFKEAMKAREKVLARETFTVENGVMRWNSSGHVPPEEWYELAANFHNDISYSACKKADEEDTEKFLVEYKARQANMTEEQRAERRQSARAAHGSGVVLVDVFTGETFIT